MDALKILLDGANRNRTLFVLLSAFALFPIYTGIADLPFWNDLAMRIMLLGMAAMGAEPCSWLWRYGFVWACRLCWGWRLLCRHQPVLRSV